MRTALPLLLLACTPSSDLDRVEPDHALPGESVRIYGDRLLPPLTVRLDPAEPGESVPLELTAHEPQLLQVTLPDSASAGLYDLVVTTGRQAIRAPASFRVLAPPQDVPCGGLYRANTKVSNITGEVVIDRFYRDGERETVKIELSDIASVELSTPAGPDGGRCNVITLVQGDGDRLRFADDATVDLSIRAHKLAQEIDRPIQVIEPQNPVASATATDRAGSVESSERMGDSDAP